MKKNNDNIIVEIGGLDVFVICDDCFKMTTVEVDMGDILGEVVHTDNIGMHSDDIKEGILSLQEDGDIDFVCPECGSGHFHFEEVEEE